MTEDCQIPFFTSLQSSPSCTPTYFEWSYADPDLVLVLDFPVDMNQTAEPLPAQFIIDVDAAAKTPDSLHWTDATTLTLAYAEAVLAPSVVKLQYLQMFPNFLSLAGQPVFPFEIVGIET